MNNGRALGVLVGLLGLLLLWLMVKAPDTPQSDRLPRVADASPANVAGDEEIERRPSPDRALAADSGSVHFSVIEGDSIFAVSGFLRTDSQELGTGTHPVTGGEGLLSAREAEVLMTNAHAPVIPVTLHWPDGDAAINAVAIHPDSGDLQLLLGPKTRLDIRVTDLNGGPIVNAEVCPVLDMPRGEQISSRLTDEDGFTSLLLTARRDKIQFRVSKHGYVAHQQCLDVAGPSAEVHVQLRRIIGYAVAIDRRWRATLNSSFGSGVTAGIGLAIPRTVHQELLDQLNAASAIDLRDELLYLQLFAETRWFEGSTGVAGLVQRGRIVARMEVPVLPILDPRFGVHRYPSDQAAQLVQHPWVHFHLNPSNAFVADPPLEMRIRLSVLNGEADEVVEEESYTYATLRNVHGLEYRAALPIGHYQLPFEGQDWQMGFDSLGDAGDPGFAPAQRFEVSGSTSSIVPLHLANGESWIRYSIVDQYGRTLDLRALLVPHRESPHPVEHNFRFQIENWPQGRFIRPGFYDLLANVRGTDRVQRIPKVLHWPTHSSHEGGVVRIELPMQGSEFDPFAFQ